MRIEEINGDEVIYMRRTGQYGEENYELMCKMKAWSNERGLLTDDAVLFGIALDNPQFTKPSECRYDVCLLASTKDAVTDFWKSFPTEMANNGMKIDFSRPIMERYSVKMVSNGFCEMCVPIV